MTGRRYVISRNIHYLCTLKMARKSDILLAYIREGKAMTTTDKLSLIGLLSVPSILAQMTSVLMYYIDAMMVGRLGTGPSASIGLMESSTWLFASMTGAASMGFSVQAAPFVGANDFRKARDVFRHGLICTFILSVLIAVAGLAIAGRLPYWLRAGADIAPDASVYFAIFMWVIPFYQLANLCGAMLKSSGDMRVPSATSILMCTLDVLFNYIFIYQCHLGVRGAAYGTAAAIIVAAVLQAYFAIFRNPILALRQDRGPFVWVPAYLRQALKIASPIALQSFLMSGAQIISTRIVAPLGNACIAAHSFAITAESLCYMPGHGIGDAATTLVGQCTGARRRDLCRNFAVMTVMTGMVVMALMGALMYVFAPEMIGFLTPVEEIRQLGVQSLRIEAFAEPFFAAAIVTYSVCVGAGDTLRPTLINLGSMWCVRLTLAAFLARDYGLAGVWTAMAIELTFRGTLFLVRLFRGKWMKMEKAD